MKIIGDRFLVKVTEREEEIRSGVIIPDTLKDRPNQGVVVEVGEGKLLLQNGSYLPPSIHVNDVVRFVQNAGQVFKHDGEEYLLLDAAHILAVLE